MATKIKDFTIERKNGRRAEEIDFDTLFDGDIYELIQGRDFKIKIGTFKIRASAEASRRGGRIEWRIEDEKVQLRFTKKKN